MAKVLGTVYRAISTHLIHKAGLSLKDSATGAVTLIQRFGSALNLNIHFHILFLDGVYVHRDNRPPRFQRVKAPDKGELEELVQLISQRVGRCLERQGLLEQDTESAWLDLEPADDTDAMPQILGSSISYRIAVGPQQGRKAFMIRTIRPLDRPDHGLERVAKANGFSLHAGVSCEGHQKEKRERLCRYIARPAIAVPRLSLSSTGKVVYTLKTPYSDGTTQVAFDPVDFIARLAALAWPAASEAEGQPHPIPRRTRAEPPLARTGHASQAWKRSQAYFQCGGPPSNGATCGDDLGSKTQARIQYRHRGLRPLRRICQSHRRGVEPLYRGARCHR